MVAADTNLLVYAHRSDSPWHDRARAVVESLGTGGPWAIPWPCMHEFLAIVTHPRIFKTPTPQEIAIEQLQALENAPNLVLLAEGEGYLSVLERLVLTARIQGGAVNDARIAALCLHHGVSELWSADRDFARFPALRTRNPLLE
ncbi:MAG: TA system VapC family ribonuclease toxin [Burkholderiales bacterium]